MTEDEKDRACWMSHEWGRTITDDERAFRWKMAVKIAALWDDARKMNPGTIERGGITVEGLCRHLWESFAETMLLDEEFSGHVMEEILAADEAKRAELFAFWSKVMHREPLAFGDREAA